MNTITAPTQALATTTQPTTEWIADLASDITEDGIAAHESAVAHVVLLARLAGATQPSLDVLDNVAEASVARERAFSHLQRHWARHLTELDRLAKATDSIRPV